MVFEQWDAGKENEEENEEFEWDFEKVIFVCFDGDDG